MPILYRYWSLSQSKGRPLSTTQTIKVVVSNTAGQDNQKGLKSPSLHKNRVIPGYTRYIPGYTRKIPGFHGRLRVAPTPPACAPTATTGGCSSTLGATYSAATAARRQLPSCATPAALPRTPRSFCYLREGIKGRRSKRSTACRGTQPRSSCMLAHVPWSSKDALRLDEVGVFIIPQSAGDASCLCTPDTQQHGPACAACLP